MLDTEDELVQVVVERIEVDQLNYLNDSYVKHVEEQVRGIYHTPKATWLTERGAQLFKTHFHHQDELMTTIVLFTNIPSKLALEYYLRF